MKHRTDKQNLNGLAIWRTQMVEAVKNPWLASILLKRDSRFLNRFIHFYRRLRAQPRRIRRFLQARMATTLVGASLLLALSSTPAYAATINVDGTTCTLVDAIIAANTDTPTGGCSAGSGADIIELQVGSVHTLTSPYSYAYAGNTGLPDISSEITIEGNGATIERANGSPSFRIFKVAASGDLTLNDATITGGYAAGSGGGGGIYAEGSLTLNNSTISNNIADYGDGGGIKADGTLTISGSTISNNAAGEGGGVFSSNFSFLDITINDSTITGNHALNNGGGISIYYSPVEINNSTITDNDADQDGGGVFNSDGDLIINNSTISGNTAEDGAGIKSYAGPYYAVTTINDSTITGNIANSLGGGIDAETGYLDSTLNMNRSLVTGNSAASGREVNNNGMINVDNYNLFGYNGDAGVNGLTLGATDIVPGVGIQVSNILDITLQNNGGDTDTHALVSNSPAVDAVPTVSCTVATDQRGVTRPQGPNCDVGAFELEQVVNLPPTADANGPYTVNEGSTVVLDGTGSSDPDVSDTLTYEWDLDYDGVTFDVDAIGPSPTFDASNLDGPDSPTVALRVIDNDGASDIDTNTVSINNVNPIVEAIIAPVDPLEIGSTVNASATFTDPGIPDSHTAQWDWGDNSTSPGAVAAGTVTGSHTYTEPGVYAVTLTVTDDDGGVDTSIFELIVIYDPDGGFVTGGGWINSPAGAYTDDPSLTGKANFGFVSKYKKKNNVPTGSTEFNFKVADLNFHSDSYDWLVINQGGSNAQFKGSGTINGDSAPNDELFKFMIWATDNDPGGDDSFRIKIWWEDGSTENTVYDNDIKQAISGGNIKVHKPK